MNFYFMNVNFVLQNLDVMFCKRNEFVIGNC